MDKKPKVIHIEDDREKELEALVDDSNSKKEEVVVRSRGRLSGSDSGLDDALSTDDPTTSLTSPSPQQKLNEVGHKVGGSRRSYSGYGSSGYGRRTQSLEGLSEDMASVQLLTRHPEEEEEISAENSKYKTFTQGEYSPLYRRCLVHSRGRVGRLSPAHSAPPGLENDNYSGKFHHGNVIISKSASIPVHLMDTSTLPRSLRSTTSSLNKERKKKTTTTSTSSTPTTTTTTPSGISSSVWGPPPHPTTTSASGRLNSSAIERRRMGQQTSSARSRTLSASSSAASASSSASSASVNVNNNNRPSSILRNNPRKCLQSKKGISVEIWQIQKELKRGEMVQGVLQLGSRSDICICAPVAIGRTDGQLSWRSM